MTRTKTTGAALSQRSPRESATFVDLNGQPPPKPGTPEWEEARRRAFNPQNPVYKGPLGERYPGYEDPQHVRDCAALVWMIIDNSIGKGTWKGRPELMARNYQIYLDHCAFVGITPESNNTVLLCYHEAERQSYYQATGKIVLPLPCYYDNEWGVEDIKVILGDDATLVDQLYSYDRNTRLNMMRNGESLYRQWRNGAA
jgi:hypothetical protein